MTISEETRRTLREIGLSTYEIEAYTALLESGQMTAAETSKKAQVPYSKVYAVLNSLKEKGWIKTAKGRPTKYYPTPPLEALTSAKNRLEEQYKSWEQQVTRELQPLYEKRELVEHPEILMLHGQQRVIVKLEEIFGKARKEIMIALPQFIKNSITTTPVFIENLQKTRVGVKVMVAGKPESWSGLEVFASAGELRARDQMFGGGVIVDEREAMLFLGEEKLSLVIWSNHAGLVKFARDYFQYLWDSSKKIR
ncbi:MAG: TrmB family transcriptional regulator [Candidatus Bathycorpusculaceae bacterium]